MERNLPDHTDPIYLGSDTLICYGALLPLSIPPSATYSSISWNDGQLNGSYSFNAQVGQNVVYITDYYGCDYFDTMQVNSEPNPNLSVTMTNDTLFSGGQLVDWYLSNGLFEQNSAWIIPEEAGIYYYVWMSLNGCEYQSPAYNHSLASVGVFEDSKPSIFPNPFDGYLQISFSEDLKLITIYDVQMKKVGNFEILNGKVDTNILPSGVYFIELNLNSEEVIKERVVKL